jgi:hypothetical protein
MALKDYIPFRQVEGFSNSDFVAKTIEPEDVKSI